VIKEINVVVHQAKNIITIEISRNIPYNIYMMITQFDRGYFRWGKLFAQSMRMFSPNIPLFYDVVNLSAGQIQELYDAYPGIIIENHNMKLPEDVAAYMVNRKVRLTLDIIKRYKCPWYCITDADLLVRKPLTSLIAKIKGADAAIVFRPWNKEEWMQVAGGLVLIRESGVPLIEKWDEIMNKAGEFPGCPGMYPWGWWWDQICLWKGIQALPGLKYETIDQYLYLNMPEQGFSTKAYIWSANDPDKDKMYQIFKTEFEKSRL
jgi:hypothetical protein